MSYHFSKIVNLSFETAIERITEELKKEGFGILTQINIRETLKNKLNVDFRPYIILGACNPQFAYKALSAEDKIGTMLPCNVVVQQHDDGSIEITAVDPIASMIAIKNDNLGTVAHGVADKLKRVIESV